MVDCICFVQQYKIVDVNKNLIQNHGSDSEYIYFLSKEWEMGID